MKKPETEQHLRQWFASKLGVAEVPSEVWFDLEGYAREALLTQEDREFEELLDEGRRLLKLHGVLAPRRGLAPRSQDARQLRRFLSQEEGARAWAFSRHLGRVAASGAHVVQFRTEFLMGATLAPLKARSLLLSNAPYLLGGGDWESMGVPFVGHSEQASVQHGPTSGSTWTDAVSLLITGAGHSIERQFEVKRSLFGEQLLVLPDALGGGAGPLPPQPGSVFERLQAVARKLNDVFPWEERDAIWFVLTGQAPWVLPIRLAIKHHQSQTTFEQVQLLISVEPWVSADTLLRFYRACQSALLGRENRPITPKNLLLLDRVEEDRSVSESVGWGGLMSSWNEDHQDDRYSERRNLRRDYIRTRKAVLFPGYVPGLAAQAIGRLGQVPKSGGAEDEGTD